MTDTLTCGWCSGPLVGKRQGATYCSQQHKKNAASKRHRERNPGYYRKYHGSPARVAWLAANLEQVREAARQQQRRYRAEHPDQARAWWAANTEKHRLYQANRRAATAANPDGRSVTEHDWMRIVLAYDGRCAYCSIRPQVLHADHVIPLKRGGRHAIGNIVPACQPCNSSKGARLLADWRYRRVLQAEPA